MESQNPPTAERNKTEGVPPEIHEEETKGESEPKNGGTGLLSKRQLKRQANKEKWEKSKTERKQWKKQKQKEKKIVKAAAMAEAGVKPREPSGIKHPSKEEIKAKYQEAFSKGTQIIIDCGFQKVLTEKELNSLARQIAHCYASNRKLPQPAKLTITSFDGIVRDSLVKMGSNQWQILTHEQDYIDVYPKDKLVYLSGDAEETLNDFDPSQIYIIGGLVDHNRIKKGTYDKAVSQGIKTAKLPLGENIKLCASPILAVNHVFDIMHAVINGKSWKDALEICIPKRKKEAKEIKPREKKTKSWKNDRKPNGTEAPEEKKEGDEKNKP